MTVSGEGRHAVSYRASDAAGNSSGARTLPVWIDQTAPQTALAATRGTGVEGADTATLAFTATDALSGVARDGLPHRRRRVGDGRAARR